MPQRKSQACCLVTQSTKTSLGIELSLTTSVSSVQLTTFRYLHRELHIWHGMPWFGNLAIEGTSSVPSPVLCSSQKQAAMRIQVTEHAKAPAVTFRTFFLALLLSLLLSPYCTMCHIYHRVLHIAFFPDTFCSSLVRFSLGGFGSV